MRRATGAVVFAKRQRLNLLRTANGPLARQLLGELMMSPEPLQRHELVHATLWVSQYGHVDLARQCLQEMSRRAMRPSLDAHNAVLKALALQHKWSTATHVLLRMEQHELEPDATSYAAVLRSTRG